MKAVMTIVIASMLLAAYAAADDADSAPEIDAAENAAAEDAPEAADEELVADSRGDGVSSPRQMSGMSVLGNEEAPKALVIVPWKSSELGDELTLSDSLDDRATPVDKEVFQRELRYYAIREGDGG